MKDTSCGIQHHTVRDIQPTQQFAQLHACYVQAPNL
jgi:hypothetical protein